MVEKSREIWEVSLASLQDHRKIATIGVRCNACAHRHSWPIEELIARHKPWALASDLWKRWRCSKWRLEGCAALWDRAVAWGAELGRPGLSRAPVGLFFGRGENVWPR